MRYYNLRADGSPHFPPQWFGTGAGVTGVTTTSSSDNVLHLCYINYGEVNDGYTPSRMQNYALTTTIGGYTLTLNNVLKTYTNYLLPEIQNWFVDYGGSIAQVTTGAYGVWFSLYPGSYVQMYPSQHPTINNQRGRIEVLRLAVD